MESYSVHIISSNSYIDIMSNSKKHIALCNKKITILSYVNFGLSSFFECG